MTIKQGDSEPLRQLVEWFNNESLQLVDHSKDFLISAFINGLRHRKLYRDLISIPPYTMDNHLEQANDFVKADEADKSKREETKRTDKIKGKEHEHQSGRKSVLDRLSCSQSIRAYSPMRDNFTPLLKSPNEIYAITKDQEILRQPVNMQTLSHKRNKYHYCEYHEDYGHKIDYCNDLKRENEMCIQNGKFSRFIKNIRKIDNKKKWKDSQERDRQYEHSQSQKDKLHDYDWQRSDRDEERN